MRRKRKKCPKKERIYDAAEEKGQKRIYIFRRCPKHEAASLDVILCVDPQMAEESFTVHFGNLIPSSKASTKKRYRVDHAWQHFSAEISTLNKKGELMARSE